jgi:hypothetical protein
MPNDKKLTIDELRKRHQELLAKLKAQGYDLDKLAPLTEQERDELETISHNAHRTGKFDWDEKKGY